MANMLHGYGPVTEGGPDVHQFYREDIGFGHIEKVKLHRPVYESMGSFALNVVFYDATRPFSRQFPSGDGFMMQEDIVGQDNGTEVFIDRAITRAMRQEPGLKLFS